jgi:hypothetical protein
MVPYAVLHHGLASFNLLAPAVVNFPLSKR